MPPTDSPEIILFAGSREWPKASKRLILEIMSTYSPSRHLIMHGCARGVDTWAGKYADELGFFTIQMPVTNRLWEIYGRAAGQIRNGHMASLRPTYAHIFRADGVSNGTDGMIEALVKLDLPYNIHRPEDYAIYPTGLLG